MKELLSQEETKLYHWKYDRKINDNYYVTDVLHTSAVSLTGSICKARVSCSRKLQLF